MRVEDCTKTRASRIGLFGACTAPYLLKHSGLALQISDVWLRKGALSGLLLYTKKEMKKSLKVASR